MKFYDKKGMARFVLMILISGLILGIAACCTIFYFFPNFYKYFKDESDEKITENSDYNTDNIEEVFSQKVDNDKIFAGGDVRFKNVVDWAEKSMVTIYVSDNSKEWPDNETVITSGLIVSKTTSVVIITDTKSIGESNNVKVSFFNGNSAKGSVTYKDTVRGIAYIEIGTGSINNKLLSSIRIAGYKSKKEIRTGEDVFVIGNTYGEKAYIAYGKITSAYNSVATVDGAYSLLTTDIANATDMNGFIIDVKGEVIGMLNTAISDKSMDGVVSGLVLENVSDYIDCVLQNENPAFLGICGADITDDVVEESQNDMPYGVYIKSTEPQSPAYNLGLLSGDIITKVKNQNVKTLEDLRRILGKCHNGEEISISVKRLGKDGYKSLEYMITV